jgi:hypothetical protein
MLGLRSESEIKEEGDKDAQFLLIRQFKASRINPKLDGLNSSGESKDSTTLAEILEASVEEE